MQWLTTGNVAKLQWEHWLWTFDLAQPHAGLRVEQAERGQVAQLLQVHPSPQHACEIEDSFLRGSDLMVRYGQSESDHFAFQLDFRAVPESELGPFVCGLDVWLSVQTQLLDSHPTLTVRSQAGQAQWSALDNQGRPLAEHSPAALVCENAAASVVLFVHPSDRVQAELISQSGSACDLRLFGNFMEKGVIRRGRLRCLLSETPIDRVALAAAYNLFAASPLPLTA
ncbi:MAG: hypothetical protein ACTHK7_00600 [Aureliella sp.]